MLWFITPTAIAHDRMPLRWKSFLHSDPGDPLSPVFGYAGLRWSQTAGYGYAPNPAMPNTFMAVSYDTPDRPTPWKPNPKLDPGRAV